MGRSTSRLCTRLAVKISSASLAVNVSSCSYGADIVLSPTSPTASFRRRLTVGLLPHNHPGGKCYFIIGLLNKYFEIGDGNKDDHSFSNSSSRCPCSFRMSYLSSANFSSTLAVIAAWESFAVLVCNDDANFVVSGNFCEDTRRRDDVLPSSIGSAWGWILFIWRNKTLDPCTWKKNLVNSGFSRKFFQMHTYTYLFKTDLCSSRRIILFIFLAKSIAATLLSRYFSRDWDLRCCR